MKWVRFAAAGLSLAAAGLLVSCTAAPSRSHATGTVTHKSTTTSRPWWYQGGRVSTCAAPALVRASGHVIGVGTCMGLFSRPPAKVTLHVGQRIDVHMTNAGYVRLPHSSFPSVLAPGAVSQNRATQTYRAARPGHAVLISHTQSCLARGHMEVKQVPGDCPLMAVTVVP